MTEDHKKREPTDAWRIEWFDSLPSTNTYLRERVVLEPQLAAGVVVAAREQTAGRGRQDRVWVAAPGRDLAFSVLLRETVPRETLPSLAMSAALGVADYLQVEHGLSARVKWPNDVRVNGRKICGILAELVPESAADRATIVLGIGLNINMPPEVADTINPPANSILRETGAEHSIDDCLEQLLVHLAPRLDQWRSGGFNAIRAAWLERIEWLSQPVKVQAADGAIDGVLEDFGPNGELLLRTDGGTLQRITSGDVSLRLR